VSLSTQALCDRRGIRDRCGADTAGYRLAAAARDPAGDPVRAGLDWDLVHRTQPRQGQDR